MNDEPIPMQEVHEIRERIRKERKGMTMDEVIVVVNEQAEKEWVHIMGSTIVAEEQAEYRVEKNSERDKKE